MAISISRERHLDVLDALAVLGGAFDLALVLVQERERVDQREILLVIAPQARALIRERQRIGVGVSHRDRPQQPLRVLMDFEQPSLLAARKQAFEGALLALQVEDRAGLLARFIDAEGQSSD